MTKKDWMREYRTKLRGIREKYHTEAWAERMRAAGKCEVCEMRLDSRFHSCPHNATTNPLQ